MSGAEKADFSEDEKDLTRIDDTSEDTRAFAPVDTNQGNEPDEPLSSGPEISMQGARLVNKETNERYLLSQSVCKIGRDKANNISLQNDSYISRHHAWVLYIKGKYFVEDLGSTNGTLLNGDVLSERKQIFPGDRIKFGRTALVFEVG